jgi:hypothetical protein
MHYTIFGIVQTFIIQVNYQKTGLQLIMDSFFSVNKHASQIPFSLKFNSGFVSGNKHDLQYLIDSRILGMIIEYKVCLSKYCKFNYLGIMNTMNQIIFYL